MERSVVLKLAGDPNAKHTTEHGETMLKPWRLPPRWRGSHDVDQAVVGFAVFVVPFQGSGRIPELVPIKPQNFGG